MFLGITSHVQIYFILSKYDAWKVKMVENSVKMEGRKTAWIILRPLPRKNLTK